MKASVFEALRLAKEARAAVQAAQGAAALVKETPDRVGVRRYRLLAVPVCPEGR